MDEKQLTSFQKYLLKFPSPTPEQQRSFSLQEKYQSELLPEEFYATSPDEEFTPEELINYAVAGAWNLDESCWLWVMCMKHIIPRLVLPKEKWNNFTEDELKETIIKQYEYSNLS